MQTMATIHTRGSELRASGLTRVRTFRVLRREFPWAERDVLVNAARLPGYHTGYQPLSVQIGGFLLSPVTTKRKVVPIGEKS